MIELLTPLQSWGLLGIMLAIALAVIGYLYKAAANSIARFVNYLEAEKKTSEIHDAELRKTMKEHEEQVAKRNQETSSVLNSISTTLKLHDERVIGNWSTIVETTRQIEESQRVTATALAGILESIRRFNGR